MVSQQRSRFQDLKILILASQLLNFASTATQAEPFKELWISR